MDLEQLVANRELLERLSREYELLKASGADVDYAAWVRQRLREAAAELAATTVTTVAQGPIPIPDGRTAAAGVDAAVGPDSAPNVSTSEAGPGQGLPQHIASAPEQLSLTSKNPRVHAPGRAMPAMMEHMDSGPHAWVLHGEGTGPASETLRSAIYGPTGLTVPSALATTKGTKKNKRVVIVSPRKSPVQRQLAASPYQPKQSPARVQTLPAPVSKLYTQQEPGLFTARPDTYVHPEARPRRSPLAAKRPDWVNAASLQAALRGAASAVPHLQAAAERERRLALSTALARQTLAAGLGAEDARAVALYGTSPRAASAAHAQYDHVLQVAQMLAQQSEHLANAVQENSEQLAKQQELLESTLQRSPTKVAATGTDAASAGPRVEVEAGPPAWFMRRGPGGGPVAAGATNTGRSRSKSPGWKAGVRSPSASTGRSTGRGTLPFVAATTSKERERSTRKDSLKALLKQVLNGAGLAGGREGQQRLVSGMAEAEKLVAAIQALAQIKKKKRGTEQGPATGKSPFESKEAAAVATQTSNPASAGCGPSAGASEADGRAASGSEPASRAPSLARSRSAASRGPKSAGTASAPASRAVSRQGSARVLRSESSNQSEPDSEAKPAAGAGAGDSDSSEQAKKTSFKDSEHTEDAAKDASARDLTSSESYSDDPSEAAQTGSSEQSAPTTGPSSQARPRAGAAAPAVIHVTIPGPPGSQAAGRMAGGPVQGVRPGLMVESLEDQVQQIVKRDAAAHAEIARLGKLDALEQRLHSMVDKVETKLARVLQPLQFNAQQQKSQLASIFGLVPGEGHVQVGPDGLPVRGTAAAAAAAAVASAAALPGTRGAGAAGGTGVLGVSGAAGEVWAYGRDGDGVVSPRSAGLSVLELQRMLIQLNRMESKEQEVRRKWFHDTLGSKNRGAITRPIVIREGQLGTLDPDDPSSPPLPLPAASPKRGMSPAARGGPYFAFAHPTTESALATVAADSRKSALSGGGASGGGGAASSIRAQDGTAKEYESLVDPISEAVLESVLRGRRRFLRAQKLADGDLLAAADPSLNPVQIMEDMADYLIDDMLREQAQEMTSLCDTLGEHIFKDELRVDQDDDTPIKRAFKSPLRSSVRRSLAK